MGKGYRLGRYRAIKPYSNGCDVPVTALAYPPADSHNPLNVRLYEAFSVKVVLIRMA